MRKPFTVTSDSKPSRLTPQSFSGAIRYQTRKKRDEPAQESTTPDKWDPTLRRRQEASAPILCGYFCYTFYSQT
ncbi:hypothetical protein AG1IA_09747 [Rhizoctonia solani AG-1 IA]|uniref:Uncharacterized protein n=1 Tax=Thanatephorus cucumeris (strain AG1-IA) TaxID=983506 RepID=L8WHM6_THACA|nr:hypothetical protein AG1IA_09747 [Rhizoctonia solani AG-1 IA]